MNDDRIEEKGGESPVESRFPELDELQREVQRRLKDNRRFLEKFLDEDFVDEEGLAEDEGEDFEEL